MHQNIGDFAESLINGDVQGIQEGKAPASVDQTWSEPNQRDITKVDVPEGFSQSVLEESFNVKSTASITEDHVLFQSSPDYEALGGRFNALMTEAKAILEMVTGAGVGTGVGDINVNLGGPGKKAKLQSKVRKLRTQRRR